MMGYIPTHREALEAEVESLRQQLAAAKAENARLKALALDYFAAMDFDEQDGEFGNTDAFMGAFKRAQAWREHAERALRAALTGGPR